MSPEEIARAWLVVHSLLWRTPTLDDSLAQLLQDYGDQRAREAREEALEDAACVCLSHARGYKLSAEHLDVGECEPLTDDLKANAVTDAAEAIRSLAHKERPR
jgi:hypothetical protein